MPPVQHSDTDFPHFKLLLLTGLLSPLHYTNIQIHICILSGRWIPCAKINKHLLYNRTSEEQFVLEMLKEKQYDLTAIKPIDQHYPISQITKNKEIQ